MTAFILFPPYVLNLAKTRILIISSLSLVDHKMAPESCYSNNVSVKEEREEKCTQHTQQTKQVCASTLKIHTTENLTIERLNHNRKRPTSTITSSKLTNNCSCRYETLQPNLIFNSFPVYSICRPTNEWNFTKRRVYLKMMLDENKTFCETLKKNIYILNEQTEKKTSPNPMTQYFKSTKLNSHQLFI